MQSGKYYVCKVDKKGRIQLPLVVREESGIYGEIVLEKIKNDLYLKPLGKMDRPLEFLSSINIKTKKSIIQMKREAEEVLRA